MWTLFGHDALSKHGSDDFRTHDFIGQTLYRYGAVPLILLCIVMVAMVVGTHKSIFLLKSANEKRIAAYFMSVIFALGFGTLISGDFTSVFPINLFLWINVGFMLRLVWVSAASNESAGSASE